MVNKWMNQPNILGWHFDRDAAACVLRDIGIARSNAHIL